MSHKVAHWYISSKENTHVLEISEKDFIWNIYTLASHKIG